MGAEHLRGEPTNDVRLAQQWRRLAREAVAGGGLDERIARGLCGKRRTVIDAPGPRRMIALFREQLDESPIVHPSLALGIGQQELLVVAPRRIVVGVHDRRARLRARGCALERFRPSGGTEEDDFPLATAARAAHKDEARVDHARDDRFLPGVDPLALLGRADAGEHPLDLGEAAHQGRFDLLLHFH